VRAVKLFYAGGRHDVTEKTAFCVGTQLFATPPPGEYYSILPDLKHHREKFDCGNAY